MDRFELVRKKIDQVIPLLIPSLFVILTFPKLLSVFPFPLGVIFIFGEMIASFCFLSIIFSYC